MADLAASVGATVDIIHRVEVGKTPPKPELLVKLAERWGLEVTWGPDTGFSLEEKC